jgi:hypothetical protein
MVAGYLEGVEPKLNGATTTRKTLIQEWYKNFWKTVNELEAKGITWEFVNDNALQTAKFEQGNGLSMAINTKYWLCRICHISTSKRHNILSH